MAFTYILGGKDNMSGRKDINGGGYNPALRTWDEAQTAIGDNIAGSASPPATIGASDGEGGNYVRLTGGSGDFTGALVGVLAWVDFVTIYNDGHYEVMGTNNDTWIDIDLVYSVDAATERAVVGGAYGDTGGDTDVHLQWGLDILNEGDTLKIRDSLTFDLNTTTVDCDGNSGSFASHIIVEGVDSDGVRLVMGATRPIIQPFGDIVGALIEISGGTDNWDWYGLDFNGTVSAWTADYGIYCNDATSDNHRFFNCVMHDTDDSCVHTRLAYSSFISCEMYGSDTDDGIDINGIYCWIIGCSIHNNARMGIACNGGFNKIFNNSLCDNGIYGLRLLASASGSTIMNNVLRGNGSFGMHWNTNATRIFCANNSSCYNYDRGYSGPPLLESAFFGYNHSYGNANGHYSEGDDASWADALDGNNVTGDPKFAEISSFVTCIDHTGPEYTVTNSAGLFYSGMVEKTLRITNTGIGGNFIIGSYTIVSFTSATEIALTSDPTNGTDGAAGAFTFVDNFTLQYGSALLGAGMPDTFYGSADGTYSNFPHIGLTTPEVLKATLGRGFNRGIA